MIEQNVHHQLKYLALHGMEFMQTQNQHLELKLMEHYGHGDTILKET